MEKPFNRDDLLAHYAQCQIQLDLTPVEPPELEIFVAQIPGGEQAVELWLALRQEYTQTGYWPLLLGSQLWLEEALDEDLEELQAEIQADLAAAATMTPESFFAENRNSLPDPDEDGDQEVDEWAEMAAEMGIDPPDYQPPPRFSVPYDLLSGQPQEQIYLALVPVSQPWELAARLRFGGWNACPEPALQICLQRYWHERYGAEPVCLSADVLEMRVLRPPQTEEAAMTLAEEQCLFCDDIVFQGVMTLGNLQKTLLNSEVWYFWWD